MATIRIETGGNGGPGGPGDSGPANDAPPFDPDETARFQIQTVINFLELNPEYDLSPGVQSALSFAQSAACDAARRIFETMARPEVAAKDAASKDKGAER